MTCPRCSASLVDTKIGKLCMDCGCVVDPIEVTATLITPHAQLVHSERRLKNPEEPGVDPIEDITDDTAFTAESNTSFGAFTWVQVAVSRFSYYAIVFVLVIVMSGLSYGLFLKRHTDTARRDCKPDISQASAEYAAAERTSMPAPPPDCK